MGVSTRSAVGLLAGAMVAVGLAACSGAGDLSVVNDGPDAVTVDTGDEELAVEADGGTVLLDYGCTPGDVTVTFATGSESVLAGPICPGDEIVVRDGTVKVRPAQGPATR